jgi:23S rRNA pseudouridine1911/1915/1917 synthase
VKQNQVIFEDNHVIVINKNYGELVQNDKTKDVSLVEKVKKYLKVKYFKPGNVFLGVVHRIDRPTSGLVIFAKTSKALIRLNNQFKDRITKKTYLAIVSNNFPNNFGSLEHWLLRNRKQNKSFSYDKKVDNSKKGVLYYRKVQKLNNYSILEIELETGRHHQIRSQLSKIGFPIMGDLKYGSKRSNDIGYIGLHSYKLVIDHPTTKKKIEFIASKPSYGIWKEVLFD